MDLTSKTAIKNLLKQHGTKPSKRLGQNFLIDVEVVGKVVEAADLQPNDLVLEIGPGPGTLTQELAKRVKKVVAVEKDQKMVEILKETLAKTENVEIVRGDILKIFNSQFSIFNQFSISNYKIVGNLPFYLTAPVIRRFLELIEVKPQSMVLMVQKEVGQRICAKPPRMNLLAVSVQFYAEPEIISYVSKESFWPSPEVDAAIIKIVPRGSAYGSALFRERFFKIVKAGFAHPRKQLLNNLSKGLKIDREEIKTWLLKNNIQPTQRAETLKMEDWLNLLTNFKK